MYIDMPTGDSIFTDTKRQFIFVILSFIVSIVYLKKTWYEYWGLWLMLLSFVMFTVFTAGSKTQLIESLTATFGLQGYDLIIGFLVLVPFVLILASIIILVDVSTAIVRKKHEGKITGNHKKDNAFRKMAYSLTGRFSEKGRTYSMEDFFKEYKDGAKIYDNFKESFDLIISAFSFLILFVYTSQFAALLTRTVDTDGLKKEGIHYFKNVNDFVDSGVKKKNIIKETFYPPIAGGAPAAVIAAVVAAAAARAPARAPASWLTRKMQDFGAGFGARFNSFIDTVKGFDYKDGIGKPLLLIPCLICIIALAGSGIVVAVILIAFFITLLLPKIFKETFNFQFSKQGWPLITYLCSLILGSIGLAYSGEALKLKSRMRDS